MHQEKEPFRHKIELSTLWVVGALEILQKYLLQPWAIDHAALVARNPFLYFSAYYSGDFGNAYAIAAFTDFFLSAVAKNKLSRDTRRLLSIIPSAGAVVFAETVSMPHHILGTPDLHDIPAGLLGTAAYVGLSMAINRPKKEFSGLERHNPSHLLRYNLEKLRRRNVRNRDPWRY